MSKLQWAYQGVVQEPEGQGGQSGDDENNGKDEEDVTGGGFPCCVIKTSWLTLAGNEKTMMGRDTVQS